MLSVFQLLLSLVTQQTEDDQHNATNEPAHDDQLEQTQGQAENAEETSPTSGDPGRPNVGNDAVISAEAFSEAANAESDGSNAFNPSPNAVETGDTDLQAPDASAEVGQADAIETHTSLSGSEPDSTLEVSGEVADAPVVNAADIEKAAEKHDDTTPPTGSAEGGDAPEITSLETETADPIASTLSEDAKASTTSPSEGTISNVAESSVEAEMAVSDQSESAESEEDASPESIEIPLEFGVIEEIYNFAATSRNSQVQGGKQALGSNHDSAGSVAKPAIVQQPHKGNVARIEHQVSLPQIEDETKLILHFSTSLQDASDSDDPSTKPRRVRFAIEISGERHFEEAVTESKWNEHAIDLSSHAGKEIGVTFLTACDVRRDADENSALWGSPRILKLTRVPSAVEKNETEPTAMKGFVIPSFHGMKPTGEDDTSVGVGEFSAGPNGEFPILEFAYESPTPISQIAHEIYQRMHAEAQSRGILAELPKQAIGMALYTEPPKLELSALGLNMALVTVSEDFEVQCTLRNAGTVGLAPANQTSVAINRVKLRRGRHVYPIKTLDAGDETKLVWNLRRYSRESTAQISVSLKYQTPLGEVRQTLETVIEIQPAAPKLPSQIVPDLHTHNLQEHVVLGNKHLRLLFVQGTRGFEYFTLSAARHGSYRQAATSRAMTTIRYRNSKNEADQLHIIPTIYRLSGNSLGESIVILAGEEQDSDGVNWRYEARFSLTEDQKYVRTEYSLSASAEREIFAFNGPMLHAGDRGYGEAKTAALFPGLEFLGTDEPSSNTRDVAPPYNNRLVPHPYKITIPLMAVEYKKTLLGLAWNPLETWDGEHITLSAVFASPNSHEKRQNHLMGLFVPAGGDWVEENCLEASTPYALKADRQLTINAHILIDGNASISDAVSHWIDVYGAPETLEPPRSDGEQLALSRDGFMCAAKDDDTAKSRKVVNSTAANLPGISTLMWYDYLATREDAAKRHALAPAGGPIHEAGTGEAIVPTTNLTLNWELPFYLGNVETGLERLQEAARSLIETQEDDGRWSYRTATEGAKDPEGNGETVLGICAHFAFILLKHARISGNENSLKAGLKALKGMDRFKVPRGALASESPLKTPNLLAAAYAVGAYVEAHAITDDKRHIERAEKWARSGLAFIYHWNLPDRPAMRFASVPAFGTTSDARQWFGVPSQWSGLVFAYHLQHLARHSQRGNWMKIAEGIVHSGMRQQWTEGEFKGTYPDGLYEFCTEGRPPYVTPENIMVNLYTLRGRDPDISTAIVRHEKGRIHLSSGAQIEPGERGSDGRLEFKLSYVGTETSHTIITGYGSIPSAVRAQGQDLPRVEDLEAAESGWLYRQEKDIVFVKCKHVGSEMTFEVLPPLEEESPEIDENPQEQLAEDATSSSNVHDESTAETSESEERVILE